jgi:hypothetical protein
MAEGMAINQSNRFRPYLDEDEGFRGVNESPANGAQAYESDPTAGFTEEQKMAVRLDAFGASLVKSRAEAIASRQTSGIEDIWREDEEFYEGIDDLNRLDERVIHRTKPAAGTAYMGPPVMPNRSRVFPNITAPFTDAYAAHISDILLPTEEAPWKIEATPIPEIDELATQYVHEQMDQAEQQGSVMRKKPRGLSWLARLSQLVRGQENLHTASAESQASQAADGMTPEEAFRQKELATAIANAVGERIWDWQVECQWNAEARAVIEDACRLGVGILKGPVPKIRSRYRWQKPQQETIAGETITKPGRMVAEHVVRPASCRIDPWNFYPHGACGASIQNGAHTWERDFITRKQLRELARSDDYLGFQILKCLEEGPIRATAAIEGNPEIATDNTLRDKYERWTFYGTAERDDLEAAGVDLTGIEDPHLNCMIVMVNNRVILAGLPALDYGGFPYDTFCIRKRKNFWAGIGVPRMIRTAQKIVVGGTRTLMDNAGLAGGPMIVFKQGVVRPADGVAGLAPRKVFYIAKDDTTIADATKAIGQVKVEMLVNELLSIVNFGLKLAEDTSGFPLMMQGQMGSAPDRVGVIQVLDRNTNAIKRRIARHFSDDLTGPHIRRYVIWHQTYGPESEKGGDLQVNVKGYAALVEREIRNQQLAAVYQLANDPRTRIDPEKVAGEMLRAWRINPHDVQFDDETWEQMVAQWSEILKNASGEDPRITVAKLNAEYHGAEKIAELQHDAEQRELDRQLKLVERALDQQEAEMMQNGVSADVAAKIKADLAKAVMTLTASAKQAAQKVPAKALPKPSVEPAGRAPAGQSYTR